MRVEGIVTIAKDGIIFDADPNIMSRVRKIFDNSHPVYEQGKHTHKPVIFPFNMQSAKDVLWLKTRYELEISETDLNSIKEKAEQFDRLQKMVQEAANDADYKISKDALQLAMPLREHQVKFTNMFRKMSRMLLADQLGLGKTASAISVLQEPYQRPAIVVVPPTLCSQWEREIKRFLPQATTHIIKGFKNYDLPDVDVIITSYNRLSPWEDVLTSRTFSTMILDEVHELRHNQTEKYRLVKLLSSRVNFCLGLSATPIFNYGNEIYSVLNVIKDGALGYYGDFISEWCGWGGEVKEPAVLNHYLKTEGLMLRRTTEEAGLKFGGHSRHVYTLDADLKTLQEVQNVAKMLALSVLSGNVGEDSEAAREFDWKLRYATGVAKAKPSAEFVKMIMESEGKVVVAAWHREIYEILKKELAQFNPVMFTGSESTKQKDDAVKQFIEGNSNVFLISLRSGAGLDGLQHVCNNLVFVELDWTAAVHDQVIGRLDRDGQNKHVNAYFLTIGDGSDPIMVDIVARKRSQAEGVVDGKTGTAEILNVDSAGKDRIKNMAKAYLESIGEDIPEPVQETGLLKKTADALRILKVNTNSEEEIQEGVAKTLPGLIPSATVEREVKFSKKSRIDFVVTEGVEKIGIEIKATMTKRADVYRQVRRYIEEAQVTSVVLFAPWHGIPSFKVDGVPVVVVDLGQKGL